MATKTPIILPAFKALVVAAKTAEGVNLAAVTEAQQTCRLHIQPA